MLIQRFCFIIISVVHIFANRTLLSGNTQFVHITEPDGSSRTAILSDQDRVRNAIQGIQRASWTRTHLALMGTIPALVARNTAHIVQQHQGHRAVSLGIGLASGLLAGYMLKKCIERFLPYPYSTALISRATRRAETIEDTTSFGLLWPLEERDHDYFSEKYINNLELQRFHAALWHIGVHIDNPEWLIET